MRTHHDKSVKGILSKPGSLENPADAVRSEIWRRQWEICDLTAARSCAKSLAKKFSELAQRNQNYATDACYYLSAVSANGSEFKEALSLAREGLAIARSAGDPQKKAQLLAQCGKCCYQMGDFSGSLAHWQNISEMAPSPGLSDIQATALNSIGLIYWKTGKYEEALEVLNKAEESCRHQQNLRSSALAMQSIGNVLLGLDRREQALEYYLRSQDLAQKIGDLSLNSVLLNNIGSIFFRKGHLSKAMEAYEKGLKLDRMLGNLTGQAKKLNNLGILLSTLGKKQAALDYTLKALEMDTSTGNLDGQMAKMGNISSMWQDLGDTEKAMKYIQRGIELSVKVGNQAFLGQFLGLKVLLDLRMGHPEEAIRSGEAALEINRRIGNRSYQVRALLSLQEVYLSLAKPKTAMDCSGQALNLIKNADLFEVEKEAVYFAHYQSLVANGRAGESLGFLESAYREVMHQAEGIEDPEGKEYYLHGDPLHRQILEEWGQRVLLKE
jgi:tetratricopeptide (TPR) repeat protein